MKFLYLCHRLLQRLSFGRAGIVPYFFYAQPVLTAPARQRGRAPVEVERARGRACLPASLPRPEAVIEGRFAAGSQCLFIAKDGELLGYLWLHRGPYREDEVRAVFTPEPAERSAWDYDVYVAPAYRLGRTFSRLWEAANNDLRAGGVCWCHSRISAFNTSSIAVHEKLGARRIGWACFLCLGRLQVMVSSLKPRLHCSLSIAPSVTLPSPKAGTLPPAREPLCR